MEKMRVLMLLSKEVLMDVRVSTEARTLVDAGHEVTVICWDKYAERPHYEIADGIEIHRIRVNKRGVKNLITKLLHNLKWWRKAYKKGMELYEKGNKFDAIHCHDLDTLPIGVSLKKKLHSKLVYDAHEIFGYMIEGKVPKFIIKLVLHIEKNLLKFVDYIITVNEPLQNYFKSISRKPITVVMNCKDLISKEYIPPQNDIFTIVYMGNLHKNRFFPDLIDVIGRIKNVKLIIAARRGNDKLYKEVENRSRKYKNIEFLGSIPFNQVVPIVLKNNAVIALFNPDSKYAKIITMNKQFEAMVCGRPIIVTAGTYPAKMTKELKCGIVVEYTEKSIKEGIEKLRDNPKLCEELGRNALKVAIEKYNWENEKRKLIEVYKNLE